MDILHLLHDWTHANGAAADALAVALGVSTVAVWALLIAAGLVLLEWMAGRHRGRR